MGTALGHSKAVPRQRRPGENSLRHAVGLTLPCSESLASVIQEAERGRIDHAEHRHSIFDQGDVHRKLAVSLDELLGPIQRVDQPESAPRTASFVARYVAFLRNDGD